MYHKQMFLTCLNCKASSHVSQMRLTWVSGSKEPQEVQYGDGKTLISTITTFSQDDMCSEFFILIIILVCFGL